MKRIWGKYIWGLAAALLLLVLCVVVAIGASSYLQDRLMERSLGAIVSRADRAAALLTDQSLHVFLCGTGSPLPDPDRAGACTAIIAGGHVVIIDIGPGSWSRLARLRLPGAAIGTVLLTHLHSDHIGDLGELAVQSWIGGRMAPLQVIGPAAPMPNPHPSAGEAESAEGAHPDVLGEPTSTTAVVAGFTQAYRSDAIYRVRHHGADHLAPDGSWMIATEIGKPDSNGFVVVFNKSGLKISAFLVDHHPVEPAYGYRVEYRGRIAVISGDTKKIEKMVEVSKGADLLVHEALNGQMVNEVRKALIASGATRSADMLHDTLNYHTSPVEAAEIAAAAHVKLLVLTHIVPPTPNRLARHIFLRGVLDARGEGDTLLGHDGLMISLPGGSGEVLTSTIK